MAIVTVIINTYNIQKKKFLAVVICEAEITRVICNLSAGFFATEKPDFAENEQTTLIISWKLLIILFDPNMITPCVHAVHSHSRMEDPKRALDVI